MYMQETTERTNREVVQDLRVSLCTLQSKTIGLFKSQFEKGNSLDLVLQKDEIGTLHTISMGRLGGFSDVHVPANYGVFKEFGNGRTLADMLKSPFELQEFVDSFKS
jgi:hypothetical protein